MLNGVNEKPTAGTVVPEKEGTPVNGEEGDEIVIVVKIPKPEALIFSKIRDTRYRSIPLEKNFASRIMDDVKKPLF